MHRVTVPFLVCCLALCGLLPGAGSSVADDSDGLLLAAAQADADTQRDPGAAFRKHKGELASREPGSPQEVLEQAAAQGEDKAQFNLGVLL